MTSAPSSPTTGRKRASSVAASIKSVSHPVADAVMQHDPPPGFFAATAQATSKAPSIGDIRRGSFGKDGWTNRPRSSSNEMEGEKRNSAGHGGAEVFATVLQHAATIECHEVALAIFGEDDNLNCGWLSKLLMPG